MGVQRKIRPTGMNQKELVDLLYMILYSIQGICAKLDDDGGVPLTTYEANCFTAIFNCAITTSTGDFISNQVSTKSRFFTNVAPYGIKDSALVEILYDILDSLETLTEQLDADTLTGSNFEALCYTALISHKVRNQRGNTVGVGSYTFNPNGVMNQRQLIDFLYEILNCLETLTEKLDLDGTVTDTNYEALWYTATCTILVENSKGSVLGN